MSEATNLNDIYLSVERSFLDATESEFDPTLFDKMNNDGSEQEAPYSNQDSLNSARQQVNAAAERVSNPEQDALQLMHLAGRRLVSEREAYNAGAYALAA